MNLDKFAIGLEFGIHSIPRIPHLRKAINEFGSHAFEGMLRRNPRILRAINDYQFSGWRSVGRGKKINKGELSKMSNFQKNLSKGTA
jgi:hypothetical protein